MVLCAYARAMRCPVQREGTVLCTYVRARRCPVRRKGRAVPCYEPFELIKANVVQVYLRAW
eukprot:1183275-Rhodomonas_salina.3